MGLLDKLMGKKGEKEGKEEEETAAGAIDAAGLFGLNIADVKDDRTVSQMPALQKAIMEYQSPENMEKREIFTFDSEMRVNPDFYLPYYWAATYHFDKGNFDEAKKILLDGIKNCNIKSVLCRRLGEFCFLKGDVDSALYWFFTTVMADTGSIDYHSYIYLGYVYEVYGMDRASAWALRRARGITYKLLQVATEYLPKKKEQIMGIAAGCRSERTAKKLGDFYRYAKPALRDI